MEDRKWMGEALAEAARAADIGEVPIGAVIVRDGAVMGRGHNLRETDKDPTLHAEMIAIREAARHLGGWRLMGCTLYVTIEPCPMCAAAIAAARIRRLYFGAYDPKSGGGDHGPRIFQHATCHHKPEVVGGIEESRCSELLSSFFRDLR